MSNSAAAKLLGYHRKPISRTARVGYRPHQAPRPARRVRFNDRNTLTGASTNAIYNRPMEEPIKLPRRRPEETTRESSSAVGCERCGAEMFRMHAVWRCPACGFKTDCCGW